MRNATVFGMPFSFIWKVDPRGHRWIKGENGLLLVPNSGLDPAGRSPFDRHLRTYEPLLERTGLFRELASIAATKTEVQAFADRFGLLGVGKTTVVKTESGLQSVRGESLADWEQEILELKMAVQIWDMLNSGNSSSLNDLMRVLPKLLASAPPVVRRWLHLDKDDPAMAALGFIQKAIDERLSEGVAARLMFEGNAPRLHLSLMPENLRAALWLQFAAAVDQLKKYEICASCNRSFEISRAPTTGKRPDARFCSDRCRVAQHRKRKEEARRLKSAGVPIKKIALRLNTTAATVEGWIKPRTTNAKSGAA